MNLSKNLFELIGVDKEEVLQLQFKISESENLDNFTKKDYELIYKLSGGDLLSFSTTRALVMLYSKEKIDAWNYYNNRSYYVDNLFNNELIMLKVLDLFSGIGGFSLGLESTGHFKTIAFVEKDKFCQKVLQKNFKNIPIEGDIRNVKGEKYKADVVTGGFPCQPFSVAGKRKGTDDDRYLWDETIRVVRECKPKYFIGENVEGLINIQQGMVLRQVQTDLEKEGFEVQCLIIPASGIGAWHQRKRVWIVGYSEHNGHTSTKIKGSSNKTNDDCKKRKHQTIESERTSRYRNNENVWMDVSNSNARFGIGENKEIQTRGKHTPTRQSGTGEVWGFYSEKEKQTSHDLWSKTSGCDAPLGQQTWWQTQSELCRIPHGVSYELDKDRANRIKSLGNSIVPQIARELGLAILEAENER